MRIVWTMIARRLRSEATCPRALGLRLSASRQLGPTGALVRPACPSGPSGADGPVLEAFTQGAAAETGLSLLHPASRPGRDAKVEVGGGAPRIRDVPASSVQTCERETQHMQQVKAFYGLHEQLRNGGVKWLGAGLSRPARRGEPAVPCLADRGRIAFRNATPDAV